MGGWGGEITEKVTEAVSSDLPYPEPLSEGFSKWGEKNTGEKEFDLFIQQVL